MTARRRVEPYRCGYPCNHLIDPAAPPLLDTCSYGAGHQSTALMVLAAHGTIPTRTFLFCNVGDDSEHPGSLEYARTVAAPYAAHHGLDYHELTRQRRDGTTETLMGRLLKEDSRSLPIPVRMSNGAPGNRSCTADFKIRVVGRWLKRHGAHGALPCNTHRPPQVAARHAAKEAKTPVPSFYAEPGCPDCTVPHPATVSIGISLDEIGRANTRVKDDWERVIYPLVGIGRETGLKMRRDDCDRLIREEPLPPEVALQVKQAVTDGRLTTPSVVGQLERSGYSRLPIPPKSSCFFCPFHRPAAWADLARERPDLFDKSAALEETLNARRTLLGKDPVFLTRFGIPLRDAIDTEQPLLPGMDDTDAQCDSGYCWT